LLLATYLYLLLNIVFLEVFFPFVAKPPPYHGHSIVTLCPPLFSPPPLFLFGPPDPYPYQGFFPPVFGCFFLTPLAAIPSDFPLLFPNCCRSPPRPTEPFPPFPSSEFKLACRSHEDPRMVFVVDLGTCFVPPFSFFFLLKVIPAIVVGCHDHPFFSLPNRFFWYSLPS